MVTGFVSYLKHLWQLVRVIRGKITEVYSAAHELTLLRLVQGFTKISMFTYESECFPYLLLPNFSTAISLPWVLFLHVSGACFKSFFYDAAQQTSSAGILISAGRASAPVSA